MSKITRNNLLLAMVPFFIIEAPISYLVFLGCITPSRLLWPISLLTFGPIWGLQDVLQHGWYGGLLTILSLDIAFLSIIAFSISRNHKVIGGICLFVFISFSMALLAGGN